MANKKYYNISELVKELKLPRSTVVAWLNRYSLYVETVQRGKRKVFPLKTLELLQEVSMLRAQQMSSSEIETELAQRHPLQAEVTDHEVSPFRQDAERTSSAGQMPETVLPAVAYSDELSRHLDDRLDSLKHYLNQTAEQHKGTVRQLRVGYMMLLLLLAVVGVAFVLTVFYVGKAINAQQTAVVDNRKLLTRTGKTLADSLQQTQGVLSRNERRLHEQENIIRHLSIKLDQADKNYQHNIAVLQNGLKEQRRQFAEMLKNVRRDAAAEKSAELARQREQFAAGQLQKLHELERMNQELKAAEKQIGLLKMRLAAKQAMYDEVIRRQQQLTTKAAVKKEPASKTDSTTGPHLKN